MIKRHFFFFFIAIILVLANGETTYAQLLEDRNKLKTSKRDRKPFAPFKKNVKKSAKTGSRPDVMKARPTRTSKDIAGKGSDRQIAPRYSQNQHWEKEKKDPPRFTQDAAGQGYDKIKVNPRYTYKDKNSGVRNVNPRFSKAPSYVAYPASNQKKGFLPTIQLFQPKPRYKQGKESNYFGPRVKAVYSPSNSMAKHNQNLEDYQKHISKSGKKGPYDDQTNHMFKTKRMKRPKNSHPSAMYLSAKYDNNSTVRSTKRKFSVTWVRVFGNKTQPKGVKKKPGKSKFDKDEQEIWNNEEREYTRN
ncbi:MAG: hypothetical protein JXR07_16760 [Reichenbachiella sp.]